MEDVKMETIVCAVDFSEPSDHALEYALMMGSSFGARLVLLHVIEVPFLPSYSMGGVPDLDLPLEQLEESARERMEEVLSDCREQYDGVEGEVVAGSPFVEIINYAREAKADMIVMGTHGRSGLKHLLIGSVAEKVVRKAPCPVLTVKHPEQDFEMP